MRGLDVIASVLCVDSLGKKLLGPSMGEQPPQGKKRQGLCRPPPLRGLPNAEEAWVVAEFRVGFLPGGRVRTWTWVWVSKEA
jgi:hypothetical protein